MSTILGAMLSETEFAVSQQKCCVGYKVKSAFVCWKEENITSFHPHLADNDLECLQGFRNFYDLRWVVYKGIRAGRRRLMK